MAALVLCASSVGMPPPVPAEAAMARLQQADFLQAMQPANTSRPVVVMLALNDATETTDLIVPHAVLTRADVADVIVVAPRAGTVRLYPTLMVQAEMDFATFARTYPQGADYVIVPAMEPRDDAAVLGWLREQHERGARVIGVCAGALVVANAGLLDHRRYVSHWYYQAQVSKTRPQATYVPHRRYVVDGDVATTTGITASVPMTISLVEAIAGPQRARALADELGVADWSPVHDSSRFGLTGTRRWNYIVDTLAFWRREQRVVDVREGSDDIALALAADAWTRTGWVHVRAAADVPWVRLRSGLMLATAPAAADVPRVAIAGDAVKPVQQLDRTLCEIDTRFGRVRRDRVEQELEYLGGTVCTD